MPVVNINDLKIETSKPLICLPITLTDNEELQDYLANIKKATFDIVELRTDSFATSNLLNMIITIKQTLKVPLIFTLRSIQEGGKFKYDAVAYYSILKQVIESGLVEVVDLEFARDQSTLLKLIELSHLHNVKVLLSYHDMEQTPCIQEMQDILSSMVSLNADIVKLATMAKTPQDVLNVLQVSCDIKETLSCPFIMISMGELGKLSRISGHIFGSCMTFAMHDMSNAPGQIDSHTLREILNTMASID